LDTNDQTSIYANELFAFLFIAFATASAAAFIVYAFTLHNGKNKLTDDFNELSAYTQGKIETGGIINALLFGLVFCVANVLNLYLSGQLPSMIFFPVYNGGVVLVSALAGWFFFKEEMNKNVITGLVIGIAGILLIAVKPF